jgi:hypothetical protein
MAQVVLGDQKSVHQLRRDRTEPRQGGGSEPKREGALILIQRHHVSEDRLTEERRLGVRPALDVDSDDTHAGIIFVTGNEEGAA